MSKILLNGKEACGNDLVNALTFEGGEIDYDTLGTAMDSDILQASMDSFDGEAYTITELIDRYLSLADVLEVTT